MKYLTSLVIPDPQEKKNIVEIKNCGYPFLQIVTKISETSKN